MLTAYGYGPICEDGVWYEWTTRPSATTTCSATCSTEPTWSMWIRVEHERCATTGGEEFIVVKRVWREWCSTATTATDYTTAQSRYQPAQPTPEELARIAEANRRAQEQAAAREAERRKAEAERKRKEEEANRRAAELLERHLDEEQRKQFRERKPIRIVAGDGAAFELGHSWSGNARELDKDGKPLCSYCIHASELLPIADHLLSQKLLLEAAPDEFRRIANRTNLRRDQRAAQPAPTG